MFGLQTETHSNIIAHAGERHDRSEPKAETAPMHPPDALEVEEPVSLESEMHDPTEMHMENSDTTGTDLKGTSCSLDSCSHSSATSEVSTIETAAVNQANALLSAAPEALVGLLIGVPIALHICRKKLWT